jgi:hypothetical protein
VTQTRIGRIRIEVDSQPDPFLLRPAIETRLDGRVWPRPVEDDVARTVRRAIEEAERADSDGEADA